MTGLDDEDFKLHAAHAPKAKESRAVPKAAKKRPRSEGDEVEAGPSQSHEPTRRSARQRGIAAEGSITALPDDEEGGRHAHAAPLRASMEEHEAAERNYLRYNFMPHSHYETDFSIEHVESCTS